MHFVTAIMQIGSPFKTGNTLLHGKNINLLKYRENLCPRFSNNSEAFASELLENLGQMFPRCYTVICLTGSNFRPQHTGMLSVVKG